MLVQGDRRVPVIYVQQYYNDPEQDIEKLEGLLSVSQRVIWLATLTYRSACSEEH
jgi:hypothetical protein